MPTETHSVGPVGGSFQNQMVGLASVGSGLYVFNKNAAVGTNAPTDPWAFGGHASHAHIIQRKVLGCYVDLFHLVAGAANPVSDPAIRVYGRLPRGNPKQDHPYAFDNTLTPFTGGEVWRPLSLPTNFGANLVQIPGFPSGSAEDPATVHGSTWRLSNPVTFFLNGVEEIRVVIPTAAVLDSASAGSMIVGHFYG